MHVVAVACSDSVMQIAILQWLTIDSAALQVLGAGGGCQDALLCLHLHAALVRVPGMVASWR